MNKKIKFGVVGLHMGELHVQALVNNQEACVSAVCDSNAEVAKTVSETYGIPNYYQDFNDLINQSDIDAVIIASPDQYHCEQTKAALRKGIHVLCEKPMALSLEECEEMINVSRETGKMLMIGQVCRYAPGFMLAKKLIDENEIGELYFVESEYAHDYSNIPGANNWRKDPRRHPMLGGGCHAVDLLRWIAGNPIEVSAYSNNKCLTDWPIDDCTISMFMFPNDVIGKVMVSIGCKRSYTMRSVFYGTRGTIIADNTTPHITLFKGNTQGTSFIEKYSNDKLIQIQVPVDLNSHNVAEECKDFVRCISKNEPVLLDGKEGMTTVRVCLAAIESVIESRPVKLK